ncbi:MAG: hypothetical protein M3Z84_03415 [Actinomycetota bacterium]|nr:hypothetical protein [Actinomycetota bacterium]
MIRWWTEAYGDPCAGCGFNWTISAGEAKASVAAAPARYRMLIAGRDGSQRHPELGWSAKGYVFHVADNLGIWTERVAGVLAGAGGSMAGYDQDALAEARGYEAMPVESGLWSLERAVGEWVRVLTLAANSGVVLSHPRGGQLLTADIVVGNCHDVIHHAWDIERSVQDS